LKKQTKILFLFLLIPIFFGSLYSVAIEYPMILQIRNDTTALINKSAENNYLLWNKTWGGASTDYSQGVALDTAGNIYCTGYTNSFGVGAYDLALVKFYPNGTRAWNTTWGGASTDFGQGVALDTAGNIYYTGHTTSFGAGGSDFALVKFGINPTTTGTTPVIPGFELTPIIVLISILIVFILNKNLKTTKKLEFANKKNCTSGCILPHQLITSSAN